MENATINNPATNGAGKLKVLVVDDHRYFRECLVSFLRGFPCVNILGIEGRGKDAVETTGSG